jgi:hypothetical protein
VARVLFDVVSNVARARVKGGSVDEGRFLTTFEQRGAVLHVRVTERTEGGARVVALFACSSAVAGAAALKELVRLADEGALGGLIDATEALGTRDG